MTPRVHQLEAHRRVQRRYRPTRQAFERDIIAAMSSLPTNLRDKISNVAVVVAEWPSRADTVELDLPADEGLLGLYHGTPLGQRGVEYQMATPDRVTIYRQSILSVCDTRDDVRAEIRATVLHELGHYFGLGDDELP